MCGTAPNRKFFLSHDVYDMKEPYVNFYVGHLVFFLPSPKFENVVLFSRTWYRREFERSREIPIFCGFIHDDNNTTPTTKNNEKLALSFLFECINPNFDPQEEILVSIESQEDEENDSIV